MFIGLYLFNFNIIMFKIIRYFLYIISNRLNYNENAIQDEYKM